MKKCLIAIAMVLTLSMNADAAAQKHRHTPRTELVDSTKNNKDAVEAYSDTTDVADDAEDDKYITYRRGTTYSSSDAEELREVLDSVGSFLGPTMALGIVALVIIFLLAPLLIIIAIFYFVNKNRREKYRLAEMAIKNGQPIPDELLKEQKTKDDWERNDYAAGMRQLFLGIGLAIFLGYAAGKIGFGIGALIFFIGLGKVIIARKSGEMGNKFQSDNYSSNSNNHSDIQDYE